MSYRGLAKSAGVCYFLVGGVSGTHFINQNTGSRNWRACMTRYIYNSMGRLIVPPKQDPVSLTLVEVEPSGPRANSANCDSSGN